MAPTSDERREIAARLRSGIVARNIPEAYVAIVQSIGVRPCLLLHDGESGDRFDRSAYELALSRLADLIDPAGDDTTFTLDEQSKDGEEAYPTRWWKCAMCGEETIMMYDEGAPVACPYCGAMVVSSDDKEME